jgi:hypothetical protein
MAVGGYLSPSLTCLPLSPVALTGNAQRFRHGGRDFGGCSGVSLALSVSLTLLPLSPVALTSDAQRFRHGGGISVVAVGSTIVVLWVFSTRERT